MKRVPCQLTFEYDQDSGWATIPVTLHGKLDFVHVLPCGDLRPHQLDPICWCRPVADDEDPTMLIHNSADGRESYERGRLTS